MLKCYLPKSILFTSSRCWKARPYYKENPYCVVRWFSKSKRQHFLEWLSLFWTMSSFSDFFFFGGLGRGHTTQKMLFLLRISPAKVSCGFCYIYWRNPYWKTFFCAVAVCIGSGCEQGIFKQWDWWERSELLEVSLNWGHF